ncbi:response regulator [Bacteroidota bacterium]
MANDNKVLIVDDIPENVDILGEVLSEYQCMIALSGSKALKIAESKLPDIILLDIMMPEMDGFEVCRRLKANEKTKDIPVIFITAKNSVDDESQGLELGAVDFISKPISPPVVKARVKTHLELSEKQKDLENLNELLDQLVVERTEKLIRANMKLSTLDKAKNQFIGLLSHELRTPLMGINGNAKLIGEVSSDPVIKDCCADILLSEERLRKFSEIALLITSINSETYLMNFNEELISEFIDSSIYTSSELIKNRNIEIIKNIKNNDVLVKADYSLLKKVFDSVMENAVKFSPNDSSILVKDGYYNEKYKVTIKDNGNGFPEANIDKQFEMFSTDNLMSHTEGTGLSLVASKAIMDAHNFEIKLSNSENGGAEVEIIF